MMILEFEGRSYNIGQVVGSYPHSICITILIKDKVRLWSMGMTNSLEKRSEFYSENRSIMMRLKQHFSYKI